MLHMFLAQVVEQLSDQTRLGLFQQTIEKALDVPGLSEADRQGRIDAITGAAAQLVAFNVDATLKIAEVVFRLVDEEGARPKSH